MCTRKPPRPIGLRGFQRSARDSNPQVLSDARFRGECNSHSASAPNNNARTHEGPGIRVCSVARIGTTQVVWSEVVRQSACPDFRGSFRTINRGARIRTGDLCDPNAALYRTEPHPGQLGYLLADGVGFEPTRTMSTRFPIVRLKPLGHPSKRGRVRALHDLKRREWDSNPRGASTNALAGRRLKPLGHPSHGTRLWWGHVPSCPARART